MSRLIASFGYVGLIKPAPGTWGSLATLPVVYLLHLIGGPWLIVVFAVLAYAVGLWAVRQETAGTADHDPSWIVIDEVVGQSIALLPLSFGAARAGVGIEALWPGWIAAFVLFRLFDIWKPGPVGRADKRGDATGVMLDDVIAGVIAALGVLLLAGLAHGVMRA